MIFVTVGTHEQQFNRLLEAVDRLKGSGDIAEDVIMQTGFSTYEPIHCKCKKLLPYDEMQRCIREARITITHGGPASFIAPLQIGKIPIVVPRQKKFDEHVNDHQLEFARAVEGRMENIILVEDVGRLGEAIDNYSDLSGKLSAGVINNNAIFNQNLEAAFRALFRGKKDEKDEGRDSLHAEDI